jgi:cell division septation protein DedD
MFLFALMQQLSAQQPNDEVKSCIGKLEKGQTEEVKRALPELIIKHQNNPGVIYLQGRLASDGIEAVKFYQSIVDNFPKSEWADAALYRIYQYYYALGLYRTAESKFQQLRKNYPNSIYSTEKSSAKLPQEEELANILPKEKAILDIPDTSKPKPTTALTADAYTLQVGAFSALKNAEKQKDFFEDRGYTAGITNKVRSGRSLYLVWVGSFKTPEEAMRFGKEVKAKYKIDSIVVERY